MSEAKFTKGPWIPTTTPSGKGKVVDSQGFSVCSMHGGQYKQQIIDAHLIAAAPELYDEHEDWARLIGAVYAAVMKDDSQEAQQLIYDACVINSSTGEPIAESPALAKARGESQ